MTDYIAVLLAQQEEQEQGEAAGKIKALRLELKKADGKKMDMDFIWHYSSQHNIVSAGDRLLQKSGQSGIKRIFSGINK